MQKNDQIFVFGERSKARRLARTTMQKDDGFFITGHIGFDSRVPIRMEFWEDFGAEDAGGLAPGKDDKSKYSEITPI